MKKVTLLPIRNDVCNNTAVYSLDDECEDRVVGEMADEYWNNYEIEAEAEVEEGDY